MIAKLIYVLCSLTCAACTFLLLRGYRRSGMRLLLWSAMCFFLLTIANIGVYVDFVVIPQVDYSAPRAALTLVALLILLFGMILETS